MLFTRFRKLHGRYEHTYPGRYASGYPRESYGSLGEPCAGLEQRDATIESTSAGVHNPVRREGSANMRALADEIGIIPVHPIKRTRHMRQNDNLRSTPSRGDMGCFVVSAFFDRVTASTKFREKTYRHRLVTDLHRWGDNFIDIPRDISLYVRFDMI